MDQEKTGAITLLHGLSLSQKGKLIWTSSFEALQSFVREALNLSDGLWSSPGGYGKLYQGKDVALRWYSDTKSIILSGKLAKEFEERLNSMASISQDLANDKNMPPAHPANNYSIQDDQMLSLEALQRQIQILTKEVNGNKAALESIRKLRMKSSPVLI